MRHVSHTDQQHHKPHNRRVGGVGKSQHGSDSHVPFQQHQPQLKDNSRHPSHSVKASRQPFHVTSNNMTGSYGTSVVNTRLIASKKFATSISDQSPTERPPNTYQLQQPDYYPQGIANESLIDPGDRVPPSGASSPSSTPNSTLGKLHHLQLQQEVLQTSTTESSLLHMDSQSSCDSGTSSSLETSKSDVIPYPDGSASTATPNGLMTKSHVQNTKVLVKTAGVGNEREKHSSLASVYNKYHLNDGGSNVGGAPNRMPQHSRPSELPMASVAQKAAMFNNLNRNNSGNTTTGGPNTSSPSQPQSLQQMDLNSPHQSSPSKSSSKGVKTPPPMTTTSRSPEMAQSLCESDDFAGQTGKTSMTDGSAVGGGYHDNNANMQQEGMGSRSSSIDELSQINEREEENENEGDDEIDGGKHALFIKPEAMKSTTMNSQHHHHVGGGYSKPLPQGPPPPGYHSSSAQSSSIPQQHPPSFVPPPPPLQQHTHHHPSHHHSTDPHHPPPPPYPSYMFTTSLSQGGLSQPLSQVGPGAQPQAQLSQPLPPTGYQAYEQHYPPGRSEISMYPPLPPTSGGKYVSRSGVGGIAPRQHHHVSPPHASQHYEQQAPPSQHQAPPYAGTPGTQQAKHQSVGYQISHDSRPGPGGVHMIATGQQLPSHLMSHDVPLHHRPVPYLVSANIVAMAHDAAGKGDINTLVSCNLVVPS